MSGGSEIEELRQLIENQVQHVDFLTQNVSSINSEAERFKTNNNTTFMNEIISFTDNFMGDSYRRVEYNPVQANYDEQRYEEILESWKKKEAEARADLAVMNTEHTESVEKRSITTGGRAAVNAAKEEMEIAAKLEAARAVMMALAARAAVAAREAARAAEASAEVSESAELSASVAKVGEVLAAQAELARIRETEARAVGEATRVAAARDPSRAAA